MKTNNSSLARIGLLFFLMVFLIVPTEVSQAQQVSQPRRGQTGSWRILGTTHANHGRDHDIIIVKGPYDYFRKLKFKVKDAPLNMHRMIVRYDDKGRPEEINLRQTIPQGGESRIIDLRGGKRKIKSVEFWYDSKGLLRGKADVILFGIK